MLRANIGGKTPSGFSLSVNPSLSKSMVSGKLMVIFERNPSSGYRTNGNDIVGVILSTVPGGNASRPSSVIQTSLFLRECGLFAPSDAGSSSFWFALFLDSSTAFTLSNWLLFCFVRFNVELWSLDCCILWHETIETITIAKVAFSHKRNTSMVKARTFLDRSSLHSSLWPEIYMEIIWKFHHICNNKRQYFMSNTK